MSIARTVRGGLEERLALMAPSRRLRLAVVEEILCEAAAGRPLRVLDAGCGDGLISLNLARRHPDWTILGIDRREDLIEGARVRARARGISNVAFRAADLTETAREHDFDAVVSLEVLEEVPDDERALSSMAEALRDGGILALQVPERDWVPVLPGSAATWREEVRHGYTAPEIAAAVGRAGLEPLALRPTFRSLVAAAQEVRDRIKDRGLAVRLAAFPLMAAAVRLERLGLTWGPANALMVTARRQNEA